MAQGATPCGARRGERTPRRYDAFISHSSVDRSVAARIEAELGVGRVWFDRSDIRVGALLGRELLTQLRKSRAVVLLWSEAASRSPWVQTEWLAAANLGKAILPLQLDPTELPQCLANTCAVLDDGRARCLGGNYNGQLGDGTRTDALTPVSVVGLSGAVDITAGWGHTCALLGDGSARCWGGNWTPIPQGHSCALLADGTVRCWGNNSSGQLGDGTRVGSATPVPVRGLAGATAVAAGWGHTCALLGDGTVRCWGEGWSPAGAIVAGLVGATGLDAGEDQSCARLDTGGVRCWGGSGSSLGDSYVPTPEQVVGLRYSLPARVLDTRPGGTTVDGVAAGIGRRVAGSTLELAVGGRAGVPVDAAAVMVNVTVTEAEAAGYVTVWPCDQGRPNASNVNYVAGGTVANLVVAKLDPAGRVCLFTYAGAHLVADVNGWRTSA